MKQKLKQNSLLLFYIFIMACGSGEFAIDPGAGAESNVTVETSTRNVPSTIGKEFFEENLFTLVSTNCATSGCHLSESTALNSDTFFQITPSDFEQSWLWINVRRASIVEGDYTDASSKTLKSQKDDEHNTFTSFTNAQKEQVDEWTALTE